MDLNDQTLTDNLPDGVGLFPFQVAGHKHGKGRLALGILRDKNGHILKPLFEDAGRSKKELSFFETVSQNSDSDPILKELASFLPSFYGTETINISGKDIKYLSIEDVTRTFQNPSVLDLKIGPITYEEEAEEGKKQEQINKFKYGKECGIRIVGMKVYDEEKQIHVLGDRMIFRQLAPDTMISGLALYLSKDNFVNSLILCGSIHKLLQLDNWFSRQRKFKFIGSSLLFVYEGTLSYWKTWIHNKDFSKITNFSGQSNGSTTCQNSSANYAISETGIEDICDICGLVKGICSEVLKDCNLFRIVMIDFAHSSVSEKEDTNYIIGLHKLIDYLKDLLKMQLENS